MYEIRLHGLGGEGVVRLSEIIGMASVACGKWAHSFPFFGTEIRGAAVKAFTRVDDKPVTLRSYIYEPDVLLLTNDVLLENPDVTKGIRKDTLFLLNSARDSAELEAEYGCKTFAVNATSLAYDIIGKPIVNTIMLGALIGATDIMPMRMAEKIIRESFGSAIVEKNIRALNKGYEIIKEVC